MISDERDQRDPGAHRDGRAHDLVGAPAPRADLRQRAHAAERLRLELGHARRGAAAADALAAAGAHHVAARDEVDQQRQDEQDQAGREQRRLVERRALGLAELQRDHPASDWPCWKIEWPSVVEPPIT